MFVKSGMDDVSLLQGPRHPLANIKLGSFWRPATSSSSRLAALAASPCAAPPHGAINAAQQLREHGAGHCQQQQYSNDQMISHSI